MADIVKMYTDKLIAMKSNQGNAQDFVGLYVTDEGKNADYNKAMTEINNDNNIINTKKAITFYKDALANLALTQPTQQEDLVEKYINVMANFHYLRMAMTIFILLQQKKITEGCATKHEEKVKAEAVNLLVTKLSTTLKQLVLASRKTANANANANGYKDASIETDAKKITDYITSLETQRDDLKKLLETSLPLISQFDANSFVS